MVASCALCDSDVKHDTKRWGRHALPSWRCCNILHKTTTPCVPLWRWHKTVHKMMTSCVPSWWWCKPSHKTMTSCGPSRCWCNQIKRWRRSLHLCSTLSPPKLFFQKDGERDHSWFYFSIVIKNVTSVCVCVCVCVCAWSTTALPQQGHQWPEIKQLVRAKNASPHCLADLVFFLICLFVRFAPSPPYPSFLDDEAKAKTKSSQSTYHWFP